MPGQRAPDTAAAGSATESSAACNAPLPAAAPLTPLPLHVHPSLPQFPTKAADARGDIGRKLPTLEDEFHRLRLEAAVDEELSRLADARAKRGGGGKQ